MKRGEYRRSCVHERCEVRWCCTAAAAVAPLLYCVDAAFELWGKCGFESSLVVFRIAAHIPTRAHTPFVAVTKTRP